MKFLALATATLAASLSSVQAWWDNGHMLVGEVAAQLMAPEDVQTLEKVLSYWDQDFPSTSQVPTAAIWPDLVKCNAISDYCMFEPLPSASFMDKLHYVNLPLNVTGANWGGVAPDLTLFAKAFGGDAGDSMDMFLRTFNTSTSLWSINLALRQLIHVVGDVHNPMHTVGGVNAQNPNGDSGGNNFTFASPCIGANLHALYDAAGGELVLNWRQKYEHWDALKKNASELIAQLPAIEDTVDISPVKDIAEYKDFYTAWTKGAYFKQFILESHRIALSFVYSALDLTPIPGTRHVACPPAWYIEKAKQICKSRIAIGGKRLAFVLTRVAKQLRAKRLAA